MAAFRQERSHRISSRGTADHLFPHRHRKAPENGSDPSNIIDYGYPIGGINLGGQTPIVLVNDSLTMGGFICPYTVPHAAFWKLAQARPGDIIRFREISVEAAQEMRRAIDAQLAIPA